MVLSLLHSDVDLDLDTKLKTSDDAGLAEEVDGEGQLSPALLQAESNLDIDLAKSGVEEREVGVVPWGVKNSSSSFSTVYS